VTPLPRRDVPLLRGERRKTGWEHADFVDVQGVSEAGMGMGMAGGMGYMGGAYLGTCEPPAHGTVCARNALVAPICIFSQQFGSSSTVSDMATWTCNSSTTPV